MADDFIVNNPGISSVFLINLGVEIPATEDHDLLQNHDIEVLKADPELAGHLTAGTLIRKIGATSLAPGDPLVEGGPVEVAQQAWTPWYQLVITAPGQTVFLLPSTPVDNDSVRLKINTVGVVLGLDFNVSGTSMVWLDREYTLDALDEVYVKYIEAV